MTSGTGTPRKEEIRVSASCLAEFATSPRRSVASLLRPYKFNTKGEGLVRSRYYPPALKFIRLYHSRGNDPEVFYEARRELQKRAESAEKPGQRRKFENNIAALDAYQRIYKNRKFKVLPARRLCYQLGPITLTATPDLWVKEGNTQVLLKVGFAKRPRPYVNALLTIIRKAAVANNHRIRARNFLYLDVNLGEELICKTSLQGFNHTFLVRAKQIAAAWPSVREPAGPGHLTGEEPAA